MKQVAKKSRNKVTPVNVPEPYSLGLGYSPQGQAQSMEAMLGKHQAKYMENIFKEMNKFTETAVMTVIPDMFAQLLNVLKQEKQRLIALKLEEEAVATDEITGKEAPVVNIPVKAPIDVPALKVEDAPPEAKKLSDKQIAEEIAKNLDLG